jgi:hypothetical protein
MDVAAESQGRTFHLIFELADVRGLGPKFQQDRHGDASNRRKMRGDVEIEFLVNRAREATRTIYARAKDEQHLCFDALYNIVVFCFVVCGKYFCCCFGRATTTTIYLRFGGFDTSTNHAMRFIAEYVR